MPRTANFGKILARFARPQILNQILENPGKGQDVTPSSADRPAEQSHYLELMISALVWRPTVRLSSRTPCARLLLAWRPWSSPFGKAAPSLGTIVLGHARERHEENVWYVGRDVSPYGCDDII